MHDERHPNDAEQQPDPLAPNDAFAEQSVGKRRGEDGL
jgi:hypothetical protein